jgi:endo-1,3(4)-beta-glucanase
MGPAQSVPTAVSIAKSKNGKKESWLESWRKRSLGYSTTSAPIPDEIPPDNIFTPTQQDDILPQVPISRHHPVPLTGIEDDDLRTLHTNSFYANAFLGQQTQCIWTHPYSIWWAKGSMEVGVLETFGMCVNHVEEMDLVFEPGNPAKVGRSHPQATLANVYIHTFDGYSVPAGLLQEATS